MMQSISTGSPKRRKNRYYLGPDYNNEIKKLDFIEYGGKTISKGFLLVRIFPIDKISDKSIVVVGPDIDELEVGTKHSIGVFIDVGGSNLMEDIERWLEIKSFEYIKYMEGIFAMGCKALWMRVDKTRYKSLETIGKTLIQSLKAELPEIDKIQATFFIDKSKPSKDY